MLRNFTAVLYVSLVAGNSLIYWDNRYLLPVIPFVALLGFEFLQRLLSAAPLSPVAKALTVGAIAAFVSIEGIDFFYQSSKAKALELATVQVNLERTRFIRENVRPTDVVLVADPGLVAWETGNPSVGMPKDLETATTIHSRYVKFNTMILDERRPRADLFSYSEDWYRVASGDKTFLGFQREKWVTLSSGQTMVLLRDAGSR